MLATVDWHIVWSRIFHPDHTMAVALGRTIYISVIAQVVGVLLGLAAALAHLSRLRSLRMLSGLYVLVIRGTPVIVQIFFVYFGANLLFGVTLIPNTLDLGLVSLDGAVLAGIIALAVNEGAYMREIIRSGIDAIDKGQLEAARSLGMRHRLAMRRIVLPQAARVIVPPLGNEFNNMMKTTSLLAFIGVYELFQDADVHYSNTFRPVEYFLAVACWYLLLTSIWSMIQARIEQKLAVSERGQPRSAGERVVAAWMPLRPWTRRIR
ncbi:MAG: polar amino acid transport system permease protein [Gaiellales bacterium]|nr:polar amino acid transport system permease protein [Gaiellales bacterium]